MSTIKKYVEKLKNPRIIFFPINIITFNLSRLSPFRDEKLWVFGACEGHYFDDNARSLFLHVRRKHPNIHTIWLTNSNSVVKQLRALGYECYKNNSFYGKWMQLKAGVSIYTNGLVDFGHIPLVGGSLVVSLWHGVGFKKIYNAKLSGAKLELKKFIDHFFTWIYRNITVVTSNYTKKKFIEMASLTSKDKVYITGQPRNDIFKTNLKKENVLDIKIDYQKKWILYMPTYRRGNTNLSATTMIKNLYESSELDKILTQNDCIFIAKLHPATPHINIQNRTNFYILDYKDVKSNQALLGVADMLITDYSSCCVDYALLNRPIIFYLPDDKLFREQSESLTKESDLIIYSNSCKTPEELAHLINHPTTKAVDEIEKIYEDDAIKGTCYSENVYKVIISNLRITL